MTTVTGKYLRILSLDGGGYRGVIELYILQKIMESVQKQRSLPNIPRPCEYFDLIVGTSTGGLVALLLGRLGWTVKEALDSYATLGVDLFSHPLHDSKRFAYDGTPRFDSKPIKDWIAANVSADDKGLVPFNPQGKCRVAITTVLQNVASPRPIMLRTFQDTNGASPPPESYSWSVADAALATSAAPTYFPPLPITSGSKTTKFQDAGAGGFNNPVASAVAEAGWVKSWSDKFIAALVSIGTGLPRGGTNLLTPKIRILPEAGVGPIRGEPEETIPIGWPFPNPKPAIELGWYLVAIASDSEREHSEQASHWQTAYFRLNPPDLGHFKLDDVSQETQNALKKGAKDYLSDMDVAGEIDEIARRLDPDWTPA